MRALRLPELDDRGRDAYRAPSVVGASERRESGVVDRVAAAPPGVQCQLPARLNGDTESTQIVHDESVEGIDAGRQRHANARSLFEDLIVVPGVFQIAAFRRVRDGHATVGNRIWIDAHHDASPVWWRLRAIL